MGIIDHAYMFYIVKEFDAAILCKSSATDETVIHGLGLVFRVFPFDFPTSSSNSK